MCVKKQNIVFVMYITKRANIHTLPSILAHTDTVVQAFVMSYLPTSRMRHNQVYSLSNAIIIVALLLITTPHSAVGVNVELICTGGCPCPSVSGLTSGEIRSQVGPTHDASVNCYWFISSDAAVTVTFSEFGVFTKTSKVQIWECTNPECDWPNTRGLGGLWGSGSQRNFDMATEQFIATTGNMQVRFWSYNYGGEIGFVMQWCVQCVICSIGKFSQETHVTSATSCTNCAPSTYSDTQGSTACTPCPANTFSWDSGLISEDLCLVFCVKNQYRATIHSRECTYCPPGSYMTQGSNHGAIGNQNCEMCAIGTYYPPI